MPAGFFERILFIIQQYGMSVLRGAGTTMVIALVSTAVGCIIGLLVGTVQTIPVDRKKWSAKRVLVGIVKGILYVYVEVFRGTPMMVQAMFIYYGLLYAGVDLGWLLSAIIIVSVNTGAYMAETTRGGILSIDPGQTEGAKAIGMNHWQTMISVILPQALRNIMPQIGNNLIINIKDTCVLSVIGVVELFFASKSVAGAYYTYFETFTVTMVVYLILTVTVSRILRLVERKMDGPDSYDLASTDTLAHTSGMYSYPGKTGSPEEARKEDRR
ncbi:MAG: amino acid ABC transporter permease [Oscillospiraceae bacterium]|jgi:putative lysine transport system permease protein|nr:amino acid ABC transporter permease [Oscillospiraceae bacterium]